MKVKELVKKFSILPHGLRYKLIIAFSLMSVIPILVIGYLVNALVFIGETPEHSHISIVVLLSVIIAWLGLFLAKGIIERVIDIALETKIITEGNFDRRIPVETSDEVGQIGEAINFLTKKIKDNIIDLKSYQDKMKEINGDIQRRVSVLSNILQIGELISSSVNINSILELVLDKLSALYEKGFAAIYVSEGAESPFTLRASSQLENKNLLDARIESGSGLFGKAIVNKKHLIIDASSSFSQEEKALRSEYKCDNIVAMPIRITKDASALLLVGSGAKDFTYTSDDIETIKLFSEQMKIALENSVLMLKAKKLEIKDDVTELFNKTYTVSRLKEEIERSIVSQRPCAFMLIGLDNFKNYKESHGQAQEELALKAVASFISKCSGPLGRAGRMSHDVFSIIMPETNKKEALRAAENITKGIAELKLSEKKDDRIIASCGVSENPLDGATAVEILDKAELFLKKAKEGTNKVIG